MTTLKFKILSSVFIALLGSTQGFSARAQVSDQPLVADPADFDFTPLLWTEATIAQSGSDRPQPVTGNEPVSVTPGESKAKEEGSLAKAAQNPIASLISLPIQWNSTPSTQWAPNGTIPSAAPSLPSLPCGSFVPFPILLPLFPLLALLFFKKRHKKSPRQIECNPYESHNSFFLLSNYEKK